MIREPNRLGAATQHHLHGRAIDRSKPLRFKLNGRSVYGYEGDTVLSAAMASGYDCAGTRAGEPLALDERFAPPVALRAFANDLQRSMPMERMPARGGLDLVTIGARDRGTRLGVTARVRRLLRGGVSNLGLRFDEAAALAGPWADAPPTRTIETDLVVVGAGLAGLSAALYAAKAGDRVVLVERTQSAGGALRLFGAVEGEDAPDITISRLAAELERFENVTMLYRTEAFAVLETTVRAHQVMGEIGQVLDIKGRFVVLATGALERLPVFPGNRTPRVTGTLAAFQRADQFGVWLGKSVAFNTAVSETYRLAMMAHDAGVNILKLSDTRLRPQSRFIEFSKAYGIQLATALTPISVAPYAKGGISVSLGIAIEGLDQPNISLLADQLIVCGGWQPDLTLWHIAGGESYWRAETSRLEPTGQVPGIALAGSVAGYTSNRACLQSGAAAVSRLFLGFEPEVEDPRFDPIYESYDDHAPIAPFSPEATAQSYLDFGFSLTARPAPVRARLLPFWPGKRKGRWPLADQARALSVSDVAAGVQLKAISEEDAGVVAQERCVIAGDLIGQHGQTPITLPAAPLPEVPPYLAGRFGPNTALWSVEADDGRSFETGLLIYANSDASNPLQAIGVVLGPAPAGKTGARVLIATEAARSGETIFIKDVSRSLPAKLVEPKLAPEVAE